MQKTKFILSVIIVCLFAFSCQEKKDDADHDVYKLTAKDIAYALGMKCWRVRLPEDLGPDDFVSVTFKHPDGTIEKHGSLRGPWKAGEVIKVIIWDSEDGERLIYTIPEGGMKSNLRKKPTMRGGTRYFSLKTIINTGDLLMKFTENNSQVGSDIRTGEIGLIVHVAKRN